MHKNIYDIGVACIKSLLMLIDIERRQSDINSFSQFSQSIIQSDRSIKSLIEGKESFYQVKDKVYSRIFSYLDLQKSCIIQNNSVSNLELITLLKLVDELNKNGDIIPDSISVKMISTIYTMFD